MYHKYCTSGDLSKITVLSTLYNFQVLYMPSLAVCCLLLAVFVSRTHFHSTLTMMPPSIVFGFTKIDGVHQKAQLDRPPNVLGPKHDDTFPMTPWSTLDPFPQRTFSYYVDYEPHKIMPPRNPNKTSRKTRESRLFPGYLERGPLFAKNDLWFEKHDERFHGCFYKLTPSEFAELNKRRIQNGRHRRFREIRNRWLHLRQQSI